MTASRTPMPSESDADALDDLVADACSLRLTMPAASGLPAQRSTPADVDLTASTTVDITEETASLLAGFAPYGV
jgi:hypothetical protein